MNSHRTDNSFFLQKVDLRIRFMPDKQPLKVLDCFRGNGLIWDEIRIGRDIEITGIDNRKGLKGQYLQGDNRKFLTSMDLSQFHVIDLDAWGIPYDQLTIIFARGYIGTVFVTFIQSQFGRLPDGMLHELGYTPAMIKKIPTLFSRNVDRKFKEYLSLHNVHVLNCLSLNNKHYMAFRLESVVLNT